MPIVFELQEAGYVLYIKFTDPWTLAQLEAAYASERNYLDVTTKKLHSLLDVREMHTIPPGFLPVARRTPAMNHPKSGALAIVGASAFAQILGETVARITRATRFKFFKNEEDARVYLRKMIAADAENSQPTEIK